MSDYFKVNSPEEWQESYDKWRVLSREEQESLNVPKSRVYLSVQDMDTILGAFEGLITQGGPEFNAFDYRRVMQMGYSLQEIKEKLQARIEREKKQDG